MPVTTRGGILVTMLELRTQRLKLIALSLEQLSLYLADPQELEQQLGFPVSRTIITHIVRRAIEIKASRMAAAPGTAIHCANSTTLTPSNKFISYNLLGLIIARILKYFLKSLSMSTVYLEKYRL